MHIAHHEAPTVFDASAVVSLTGDAGDPAFAEVLVATFRRMLPQRVRRITAALGSDDLDEAMEAVLSLKVSACTFGAGELCDLGGRLEAHLRRLDLAQARAATAALGEAARRADAALGRFRAA